MTRRAATKQISAATSVHNTPYEVVNMVSTCGEKFMPGKLARKDSLDVWKASA
jgi:hypothetical protein